MPGFRALSSALAAAACAAALAACGGDDEEGPIPGDQGNELIAQLDEIEAAVQAGDCDRARDLATVFATNVDNLPLDDDPDLRDALVNGGANLVALTEDTEQCTPETGATGETDVLPTEPTTTTEPETTTTTTTEEPEDDGGGPPDQPPGGGKGQPGGGNGNDGNGDEDDGDDSSGGIGSGG